MISMISSNEISFLQAASMLYHQCSKIKNVAVPSLDIVLPRIASALRGERRSRLIEATCNEQEGTLR
jgi:hypothetical protein